MSEINKQPDYQPLEQVVTTLTERERQTGNPMFFAGHGSPIEDPTVFFSGLGTGYGSVDQTALYLGLHEPDLEQTLSSWEHRTKVPSVVLIAAEAPGEDSKLDRLQQYRWIDGLIQPVQEHPTPARFKHTIPSEWILGVFNTQTGQVAMNPTFTGRQVTPEDMETSEGDRYQQLKVASTVGGSLLAQEVSIQETAIPKPAETPDEDALDIW